MKTRDKNLEIQDTMLAATTMFRQLALPLQPGDSVKAQINRAARQVGLSPRRAKSVWYAACKLWQHEYAQICDAYERYLSRKERELENEILAIRAQRTAREMERRQYALDESLRPQRASLVVAGEMEAVAQDRVTNA